MPEWLIERGIGETRFALVENGEIVEARILVDGILPAGSVLRARLKQAGVPAVAELGEKEFLLPKGATGFSEGMVLNIEITREAIPGTEPWKRPLARVTEGDCHAAPVPEGEQLPFPAPTDRLAAEGWPDLIDEARSCVIAFPGGELRISTTPAMTLIDVDGSLPPYELAMAGARAAAHAIRRHNVGGSIGIDFPTVGGKAERQAIGETFDALLPQPFERTAVNGFGFLQIVRPRRHASMFELAADRGTFEARALLRAAALGPPGSARLVAHPAVIRALEANSDWIEALEKQVGGRIALRADPPLTMSGGYAEAA